MLLHETEQLLRELTSIPLSQSKETLRNSLRKAAEKAVAQGVAGSEFARFSQARVYYDHFENLGNQIWSEIKRVLQGTRFECYPKCEDDIFAYWQRSLDPVYEESRSGVYTLLQPTGEMPKPAFKDHCEQVERRISAEIKIFCTKLRVVKREEEKIGIQQNFYGDRTQTRTEIMRDKTTSINVGINHGQVGDMLNHCTNIINQQPEGPAKQLQDTLCTDVRALIAALPATETNRREKTEKNLKRLLEAATENPPEREWYSVSAKGLLEAAGFVKDFSGKIAGTISQLGKLLWPDFTLPGEEKA